MKETNEFKLLMEACYMEPKGAAGACDVDHPTTRQWACGARTGPIDKYNKALKILTATSLAIKKAQEEHKL